MVLVTGGTGFIGGHLLEKLRTEAAQPRVTTRRNFTTGDGFDELLQDVDTVIHVAGVTKALRPEDYYSGNVRATELLARAVANANASGRSIRLVHVSSLAAAGPSGDGTPVAEDDAAHPLTHYGKSKLAAELVVRKLVPEAVIVRPPVVYGPRDTGVFSLLRSIARGVVLEIAGGERWFSSIFVADLVDGLLAAARAPQATGRTYFMAYEKPATWTELGEIAARIMGKQPRLLRVPLVAARGVGFCAEIWSQITRRPGIISREKIVEAQCRWWVCDSGRARRELGFAAPTALQAGLSLTLAWYKEAGWLSY
jgi:nucleoside-diphosphate-sugar epimerase